MTSSDQYNHTINLVDTTKSPATEQATARESTDLAQESTRTSTGTSLRSTVARGGSTLKGEWTKRKYARYQEGRYVNEEEGTSSDERQAGLGKQDVKKQDSVKPGRLRDKITFRNKKTKAAKKQEEFAVDILYENQRGSFFCGIPLYSSASLLNFDPSAWQTAEFADSPVDITNAQLPDPTWQWAWKRWYVDMSHDVDEEGWEYSFSFSSKFAWHGTHPWLYSFARRRRWLRKRVKIHSSGAHAHEHCLNAPMTEGHRLNDDYFTIHPANRQRSRESSLDRATVGQRSSWIGSINEHDADTTEAEEDITNVPMLIKRLKCTTIDRKKLECLNNFLSNAEDEVAYLPEIMSEIMELFMYQSSRRQAIQDLEAAAEVLEKDVQSKGKERRSSPAASISPSRKSSSSRSPARGSGISRQLSVLRKAIDAVSDSAKELEYWSDVKELTSPVEGLDYTTQETQVVPAVKMSKRVDGDAGKEDVEMMVDPTRTGTGVGTRIKGIPKAAGLDDEVGLVGRLGSRKNDKGKGKEN